jgi:putative membrane protein
MRLTRSHTGVILAAALLAACNREAAKPDTTAAGEVAKPDTTVAPATTPAPAPNPTWTDGQIIAFAAAASTGEIEQGKLAAKKATNAAVKAFARQMVTDHQTMLREGNAFAKTNSITPDTTKDAVTDLMKGAQDAIKDLNEKPSGKDWDKNYMDKQIDAHKAVLDKLQDAEKSTTNTALKDLLNKAVGKVQSHLTKAQDVKDNKLKS